jgi:hypothetical protein
MLKIILGLLAFGLFVWIVEFGWFYYILHKRPVNDVSDAIVVFGGEHRRTVKGFELANLGLADNLIVSPASALRLKHLDTSYRKNHLFNYIIEDRAETTFQNAVLVAQLVQRHNIQSVLLVTSDYHMPRSYFLLRIHLILRGVSASLWPVEIGRFSKNPISWSTIQKKRIYNEMVELWGSVAEMVYYRFSGGLPGKGLKQSRAISSLRSILLFDIKS